MSFGTETGFRSPTRSQNRKNRMADNKGLTPRGKDFSAWYNEVVLEAELAKYDAEEAADSVRLRVEVATANAAYTEKLITLMQQRIQVAREAAAEEAVRKARQDAISADPALKEFAEQNQKLAETSKAIAEALAETEAALKVSTSTHEDLLRQFAQTKKKVDAVGLTSSVGALLRKERTTLPNVESRQNAVASFCSSVDCGSKSPAICHTVN